MHSFAFFLSATQVLFVLAKAKLNFFAFLGTAKIFPFSFFSQTTAVLPQYSWLTLTFHLIPLDFFSLQFSPRDCHSSIYFHAKRMREMFEFNIFINWLLLGEIWTLLDKNKQTTKKKPSVRHVFIWLGLCIQPSTGTVGRLQGRWSPEQSICLRSGDLSIFFALLTVSFISLLFLQH